MSTEPEKPDNPNGDDSAIFKLIWLPIGFVPAGVGLSCGATRVGGGTAFLIFLTVNIVLSVMAARGLGRILKNKNAQIVVAFLLFCFFFVANIAVVIFTLCSQNRPG